MSNKDAITRAQRLSSGARFFRCALQVNPFDYIPDGHFKMPNLWPGQNAPGDSRE
jgi:hypothetical protein